MSIILNAVFILALIFANGVLAMAEIAVVSARKARLQQRINEGEKRASIAMSLAKSPGDFLSTVQIGITLVGVLAGALGEATLSRKLTEWLSQFPSMQPYSHAVAITLVVATITYLTLILGELAPKRLALNDPDRVAVAIAAPMRFLSRITAPMVRLLSFSTDIVLGAIGAKPSTEPPITEEEIKVLIEQGTQAGVFAEAEQDMVQGVFRLGDRRVNSLMTPRTEIVWLDLDDSLEKNRGKIIESAHARFPVAKGNLDRVIGIVQAKDLLARCLAGESVDFRAASFAPRFVPENMPALKVLEVFKKSHSHTVMVIDEYGGVQGLVTIYDILESIVGDIPDIGEPGGPDVIQEEDGSWLMEGRMPIDEFKEAFHIRNLPGEEQGSYETLGGFIMTFLRRIPNISDQFEWAGLHFQVMEMDGFRVDKVRVTPVEDSESNQSDRF
jgi:putative hemolysin